MFQYANEEHSMNHFTGQVNGLVELSVMSSNVLLNMFSANNSSLRIISKKM